MFISKSFRFLVCLKYGKTNAALFLMIELESFRQKAFYGDFCATYGFMV